MAKLIYSMIISLDGYVADAEGKFDWGFVGDEVFGFINEFQRKVGTDIMGRKMYEMMVYWETADQQPGLGANELEFTRLWQQTEKIVFSKSLEAPQSARTRIERDIDPEAIRSLKAAASDKYISVSGPTLAAQFIRAGLVDEYHIFTCPIVVGGGLPFFPPDAKLSLELTDERRFASGVVYTGYRTKT